MDTTKINSEKIKTKLSPDRSIYNLIGCLCNNLDIIRDINFDLNINDFPKTFHKIIFGAIENLKEQTEGNILTEKNIDDYLSTMPKYYKLFTENNGREYIYQAKQTCDKDMAGSNIQSIKKFSLLRDLSLNGFDISKVYDYDSLDEEKKTQQREKLENMSRNDIIDLYSEKIGEIQLEYQDNKLELSDFVISENIENFIEEMQKDPDLGYTFRLDEYNTLFRGMRSGKFLLRSGSTGTGKTRHMLADALNISCEKKYEKGRWRKLDYTQPCLFISTELNRIELQTIAISYLTNIEPQIIQSGQYNSEQLSKIKTAISVLKSAPLFMVYVEDFTIQDIENIINRYIKKEGVKYIFFDYIQITPALTQEINKLFKNQLREDQIMTQFAGKLKQISEKFDVYIESATQLNRNANDSSKRDAESLRGGYSTADKIDYGVIISKIVKDDRKFIDKIVKENNLLQPNFSHWVYKNRAGMAGIVLWTKINMATMKEEFCFATDYNYNLIMPFEGLKISYIPDEEEKTEENVVDSKW